MGKGARSRTQRVLLKEQVVRMGASNQIAASPTAATDRADEEADGQIQAGIAPFAGHAEHENALEAENARLKAENAQLLAEIAKLEMLNGWYLEQFRLAQQRRFGASSEKTALTNQLSLFNEAELIADAEPSDEPEETVTYTRKKRKGKREDFFEGLPTEQVVHELPEGERICPICGGLLRECGHEVLRREVEIIPAQVKAVEHVQTVYSCDDCARNPESEVTTMVKAPVPAPVIAGSGIASPSLLSFILCNKYVLALPLNRQEEELRNC